MSAARQPHIPTALERWAVMALADEIARTAAAEARAYTDGYGAGVAYRDCFPPRFDSAIRHAFAAGQRAAHRDQLPAFDAGWAACLDRFAELAGGRIYPAHPSPIEIARWTRHSPRCRKRGGKQSCQWARCIPGGREDAGNAAPWDETPDQMRARVQRSWQRAERRLQRQQQDSTEGAA